MSIVVLYQHLKQKIIKAGKSIVKLLVILLVVSWLSWGLTACNEPLVLTPPPQFLGATLNSLVADGEPRYSFDGKLLVFSSDRQNKRSIYLYDVPGQTLVNLPGVNQPNSIQDQPDISGDGRFIVYISEQFGRPEVLVYDRLTFDVERISENILAPVRHPTISGNGRFVAFEAARRGQWDIEIIDRGEPGTVSSEQ
jgi:Tol biopolymer transport system component